MKKKVLSLILAGTMTLGLALTGCGGSDGGGSGSGEGTPAAEDAGSDESSGDSGDKPYAGVTLKWWAGNAENNPGTQAVMEAATEKLGMEFEVEVNPGGSEGDNIIKTRMASGDLPDFMAYNSGSKLYDLNPSRGFMDISDWEIVDKFDDAFLSSVTIDGAVYGAPQSSTQAGAVIYYKPDYEELKLEVPHTWDEFVDNCKTLADAGKTPVYFTGGETWATQVLFLGDYYNIAAANPTFADDYTEGKAKYADVPEATRSWTKYEDLVDYLNADKSAATVTDGNFAIATGEATHWFILTQQLPLILENVEDPDDIGVFGVPGDDADDHGLTVWEPMSWYVNKDTENVDAIKAFFEFYYSEEALDLYFGTYGANGPSCIKGYELPDSVCSAVRVDMQKYFDDGKTVPALEYQSPIKGTTCEQMTTAVGLGQMSGEEAAAMYDDDCKKSAVQLGYDWE
ncbi:ABC transporter substrate-binding protein [Schaedlerella sp.]|jgi:raffinose/stachyose/melibiose transport system substrate-binding protein|uniref:ABC transporter substrate-binding protein n=1 Tax=Schaedlerella sp. TaxID=2676057 RepID=UPI003746F7CD|nr:extracellular solute-binding protein [Ruminococcus sp.]MCI9329519.1 extracellular solute-binding protein [Ruminococcus sp.]